MKTLKNIGIFFLLAILTCGVVFVPQIISGQKEEHILSAVLYRNYSAGNRPKITSKQVAELYNNREITIGYIPLPESSENSDNETVQKDISNIIELIFGEDETVCEPIKTIIASRETGYSRSSSLVKIYNQPTALNFVYGSTKKDNVNIEILYEEKTKTVIRFICDNFIKEFGSYKEIDLYAEKVSSMINGYYEKQLNLGLDEYFCFVEYPLIETKSSDCYIANIQIIFGLMQQEEDIEKEYQD